MGEELGESLPDYEAVGNNIKASYGQVADQYRRDDEIEVTSENHQRLHKILGQISSSFGRAISVLDVGCGTGRHFHCLQNVARLVGVDVSPKMLQAAENPVRSEDVSATEIRLICGNIFLIPFPVQSFDFIYSLGMFGHGCPVNVSICNKLHDLLVPGGQLFFDVVDMKCLPTIARFRKAARNFIYPRLPKRLQEVLDGRAKGLPFFGLDRKKLERIMRATRFADFSISPRVCKSPLWEGSHLECQARKSGGMDVPQAT